MGCKTLETTYSINNTFGPGTTNKHTVQWWFKKFCKGEERLEDKEHSGWHLEVDNYQLRAMIKADHLTQGVAEELNVSHSTLIWYLKQIGKVKKLHKWVPHELTKNSHFEVSSSLILHNNNEPFLDWIVTYDDKWILYDNQRCPPQWSNWAKAPKHFQEPNFHQKKKKSWSLFGGLLPVWFTLAFWIPEKPLYLRSMLSRSMRCTRNCNACSQH